MQLKKVHRNFSGCQLSDILGTNTGCVLFRTQTKLQQVSFAPIKNVGKLDC